MRKFLSTFLVLMGSYVLVFSQDYTQTGFGFLPESIRLYSQCYV